MTESVAEWSFVRPPSTTIDCTSLSWSTTRLACPYCNPPKSGGYSSLVVLHCGSNDESSKNSSPDNRACSCSIVIDGAVGAHGPGPPSSPTAGAGLPSTDVMDPAIPTSACGGEAYPNKDKAAAISRSMAQGGEAYPNKDKAAAIWRSRAHGREAYPNKDKAAAMLRSREPSLTSVEVV